MDSINNNLGTGPELYAMKKAMEIQGQGVMEVLESAAPAPTVSSSELTGLGQSLDIKA